MVRKGPYVGLITKADLKELAGERYFDRGLDYFEGGAILHLRLGEDGEASQSPGPAQLNQGSEPPATAEISREQARALSRSDSPRWQTLTSRTNRG